MKSPTPINRQLNSAPVFPTPLHQKAAESARDFFLELPETDTFLVVNSCARGLAVPESDLDFAVLVKPATQAATILEIENRWKSYAASQPDIMEYKQSSQFAHLHLDMIDGDYKPTLIEVGEPSDYFELEIGNQICYSAVMGDVGSYFRELQGIWLPYYDEKLRLERFSMLIKACNYDLDHIPIFVWRGLYFQAFDILYKAFQEYLQTLFIAYKTYPIAYNKWIKEQVAHWLHQPDLYAKLPPILSVSNLEGDEINQKVILLRALLEDLKFMSKK